MYDRDGAAGKVLFASPFPKLVHSPFLSTTQENDASLKWERLTKSIKILLTDG